MEPDLAVNVANSLSKLDEFLNQMPLLESVSRASASPRSLTGSSAGGVDVDSAVGSLVASEGGSEVAVGLANCSARAVAVNTTAAWVATLSSNKIDEGTSIVQALSINTAIIKTIGNLKIFAIFSSFEHFLLYKRIIAGIL